MKTFLRWCVTCLLVAALLMLLTGDNVRAQSDPHPQMVQQGCGAGIAIGLVVVAVGAYVVVKLVQFCKRHLPNDPPPQPPPSPSTNAPPNKLMSVNGVNYPVLEFGDEAVDMTDIRSFGWQDGSGLTYHTYFCTQMQATTNLNQWTDALTLKGWVSPSNCIAVVYRAGVAILTNYAPCSLTNIQPATVPGGPGEKPQAMFLRLMTP